VTLLGALVLHGNIVPVDDVPEVIDVFAGIVLVLEVVSMLPDIKDEQWPRTLQARLLWFSAWIVMSWSATFS
jgi:hypothetical protein